jgi:hypothetical protein
MALPAVSCPCCNVPLPLEAWIAHAASREAFLRLSSLHPSLRLPMTALRYVGLFAPRKQTMRWERIADVLAEVQGLISTGQVEWKSQVLPAPLDYWLAGMETMLARADLVTPLGNHNYLKSVVAGMSETRQAGDEAQGLARGRGETPVGAVAPAAQPAAAPVPAARTRGAMPTHIREQLDAYVKGVK